MKKWLSFIIVILSLIALFVPRHLFFPTLYLPDTNDSLLITYIINQVQKNILHFQPLYFGTFFAPQSNTLTYSDLFLTSSLISLPIKLFSDNPLLIYNFILIFSILFTAITTQVFLNYLTRNFFLSSLCSLLFVFSGFHFHYLPHLQLFNFYLVPLSCLFFLQFLDTKKTKFLILFCTTFTLQIADSFFTGYLIFFAALFIWLFHKNRSSLFSSIKKVLLFIPLWGLLAYPYWQLHHSFPEATRPIRDAAHFALGPDNIFTFHNSLILIIIFFFITLLKHKHWSLSLSIFSAIMSLGPVLKWSNQTLKIFELPIPLPYAIFYYIFPGFNGFRTPSRFMLLFAFAIIIYICTSLNQIKFKYTPHLLIIAFVISISFLKLPIHSYFFNPTPPPVYQLVKNLPKSSTIIELPILLWNMQGSELESQRSIYSLYHNHRRLNGYSGFAPLSWITLVNQINSTGLNATNTATLKNLGITHIVTNNRLLPLQGVSLKVNNRLLPLQ